MSPMMKILALVLVGFMLASGPVAAVQPDEVLDDPELEQRARVISLDVRCLVCQNQSIDDSNADLARDLRVLVRERLVAGDTNQQVLDYLVERYGPFVLLEPPKSESTYLLWYGPAALLGIGALSLLVMAMRRRREEEVEPLSAEERSRIDALLGQDDEGERR
jgi:cytochrome c-type biogenesis protein CcmH